MAGIRTIFFDAAGTLFKVRDSVGEIYADFARRLGFHPEPGALNRNFRVAFKNMSAPGFHGTERQWWLEVVRQTLQNTIPPSELESYFEDVYQFFRSAEAWQLYPEVTECLDALCRGGYHLGIISNFDSRLRDLVSNLGIGSYFEQLILSWEVGSSKPDPRVFSIALQKMHTCPSEAMHVGDSVEEDIEGAKRAGLTPILLDRRGSHSNREDCLIVHNLLELPQLSQS